MPNYEDYLEHFFEKAETSIREGKGQELTDNLSHLAELIQKLIDKETVLEGQFRADYRFCKRRYIRLYNNILDNGADEDLRETVINSISAEANYARQANDRDAFDQLLNALTSCYVSSYPKPGFDDAIEQFFERYNTLQYGIAQNFQDADNVEQLAKSREIIETLLEYYREIWRYSVEYECKDSIKRLHNNLTDVRAFERFRYSHTGVPSDGNAQDILAVKQKLANTFRKCIQIQKFAAYSWAYKLYAEDVYSDKNFIQTLYRDYAEKNFSSIKSLSETYFEIGSVLDQDPYWENWETSRQLQNAVGPIMTSMGTNTWVPKFYLAFSLYLFDENTQDRFSNSTPEEVPIPAGRQYRRDLNSLHDKVQEFKDDYLLDFLLDSHVDLDKRVEILSKTFDQAHSHAEKQAIMRVRNHQIEPEYLDSWEEQINDQFDSSSLLRQGLKEAGLLREKPFPPNIDGIRVSAIYPPKRMFVPEEGVSKPITTTFRGVFDRYNEYVLRRLTLEEHNVDSIDELLNEIEDQVRKRDASVILLQTGEHRRRLLDDDRFAHDGDISHSHHSFLDIPILTEPTDTYTALLLLENESRGVEFVDGDGQALDVKAAPGEETAVLDMSNEPLESIPYKQAPHDYVELDIRLRGFIQSKELDGVLFHLDPEAHD
ncbi:hypothetical protein [Natrinema ejinorense]|uniref:Uncharacterized protein n=1 Tax=Natrinema ejinorense TaxID=373386 RepID=A0A2A5QRS6_9EURY|nr:hypothetical protein [Natrinema ejinorense]PCR89463.1 hypothetical protein CP557_02260 [Natrinema ejinorense]